MALFQDSKIEIAIQEDVGMNRGIFSGPAINLLKIKEYAEY